MKRTFLQSLLMILILFISIYSQPDKSGLSKITTNDNYDFISINQVKMWVSNNGDGSHDPQTDLGGFNWPGGPTAIKSAVFQDGLVWGGKVNNSLRVNGNTHRQGLQAGKILQNGTPDDPSLPKYRVYKILKGWENLPPGPIRDEYELDYNEWPVEDGAPWVDVNGDGVYTPGVDKPKYVGDETLWYVANDMEPSRTTFTYGTMPIGLEFQTTIWAFDSTNFLGDVVFKKYRIINKSNSGIDSLFFTYWSDDDLGNAQDDYSGCDPYYSLAYTYNADNNDEGGFGYGTPPPAVGYMFVQGPVINSTPQDSAYINNTWRNGFKNLPMTSHLFYVSGISTPYLFPTPQVGAEHFYYNMKGLNSGGVPFINPITNQPSVFLLDGDPVAGTGWYEGAGFPQGPPPLDRKKSMSSGPTTLAVGDTQEVVVAIFMAIGTDNINSVAVLKEKALAIQNFYGAFVPNIVAVDDDIAFSPDEFMLMQNYPNPFNPTTKISWQSPVSSHQTLKIYDVLGNEVATLVNEERPVGIYEVEFDASALASGVYFYKLQAGQFVQTRKMILVK